LRGEREQAADTWREVLRINPGDVDALANLGILSCDLGRISDAIDFGERALKLDPNRADVLSNLGIAYEQQGRLADAVQCFRRALAIDPRSDFANSNLLMSLQFDDSISPREVYAEHARWAEKFAEPLRANIKPHDND